MAYYVDIFFISIFVVTISIILGLYIVPRIDNASNPDKTPQKIILQVKCVNGEGIAEVAGTKESDIDKDQNIITIDNNKGTITNSKIEKFNNDIKGAQKDYIEAKIKGIEPITSDPDHKDANKEKETPLQKEIREFGGEHTCKNYIEGTKKEETIPREFKSCNNVSINNKFRSGRKFPPYNKIACDCGKDRSRGNYYNKYVPPIASLEDYRTYGSNYFTYSGAVAPYNIGIKIMPSESKAKKQHIPRGMNYAFANSPSTIRNYTN